MKEKLLNKKIIQICDQSMISVINCIKCTPREIEIIACIVNGRNTKSTANLLNISTKTVENHIRNLMLKFCCNSRDAIARVVEKSAEYNCIKAYYLTICENKILVKIINDIASFNKTSKKQYTVVHNLPKEKNYINLLNLLAEAGIIIVRNLEKASDSLSINSNDVKIDKDGQVKELFVNITYYLYKNTKIVNLLSEFSQDNVPKEKHWLKIVKLPRFHFIKFHILLGSLGFCCVSYYVLYRCFDKEELFMSNLLPMADTILIRNDILEKIDRALNKEKGSIKTIVLVGSGGVGKTTVARKFISEKKFNFKWEINAETRQNVINSFLEMANVVADNDEKKEKLLSAKSVFDIAEKEKKIFKFIASELKKIGNWFLIFDNMEDIDSVHDFIPFDSALWGSGSVIVTTRNENLKHSHKFSVMTSISVGCLTENEQFKLFCNILYGTTDLGKEKTEKVRSFLTHLPKFPLDVSISAYYIKQTESSFEDYILNVISNSDGFDNVQKKIIGENTGYIGTRKGIVVSNFKNVIKNNEEFKDLLLFICLLDSQNIHISYLKKYKKLFVVDDFIYHLKKYSLVNVQNNMLFVHRSIQEIGLAYIINSYSNDDKKKKLKEIIDVMTTYGLIGSKWSPESESCMYIKERLQLLPHIESLLKKVSICISDKDANCLRTKLMLAQVYLSQGIKSASFVKDLADKILQLNKLNHYINDEEEAALLLQTIDCCFDANIGAESKKYVDKCISICNKNGKLSHLKAICLAYLARYYFFYVDKAKGKEVLDRAIDELKAVKDDELLKIASAHVYIQYGVCYAGYYLDKEENCKSIDFMNKTLNMLGANCLLYKSETKHIANAALVAELKFNLFKIYNTLNEYDKALECAEEIKFLYEQEEKLGADLKLKKAILDMQKGRLLLRLNKAKDSYDCLANSINVCLEIDPTNLTLLLAYVYKAEAAIRIGKYEQGYEDSLLALKQKESEHKYADLVDTVCYYNMAVAKYKLGYMKEAYELFKTFFESSKSFCKSSLLQEKFEELLNEDAFAFSSKIDVCMRKSRKIFRTIYSETHPFVKDYVYRN